MSSHMPWRDLRYPKPSRRRLLIGLFIALLVLTTLAALTLNYIAMMPTCSLEAPILLHQLTGCRVV